MAIARGAGTEIIRSAHFEDIDDTRTTIIFGVQHHIYTVLSVISACTNLQTSTNSCYLSIQGYDAKAGTTAQLNRIFGQNVAAGSTFVWNDKFSFNGHEPVDFTGPIDTIAKQDAIADQGSAVAQLLTFEATQAADSFEVTVTYIDQNNA